MKYWKPINNKELMVQQEKKCNIEQTTLKSALLNSQILEKFINRKYTHITAGQSNYMLNKTNDTMERFCWIYKD